MKLIRPTDDELNAAFAEKVCNWSKGDDGYGYEVVYSEKIAPYKTVGPVWKYNFVKSADVVLPYLEKMVRRSAFNDHTITVTGENYYIDGPGGNLSKAPTLAKACVIALLRAHGVEVET